MSETENQGNQDNTDQAQDAGQTLNGVSELDLLKSRAKMMGITFSNNIGLDALKAKIQEKLDGTTSTEAEAEKDTLEEAVQEPILPNALEMGLSPEPAPNRPETLREKLYRENMYLIRCRITNLDPKKKDLPGEVITVANEFLGTVRKYVPFGEHTDDGYHIPKCIYEMLKERRFLNIRTTRDRRTGAQNVSQSWAPEFAIEILEPLTPAELQQLGQAQIAAGSVDANAA